VWHGLRAEADLATDGGQQPRREAEVSQLRAQMLELADLAAAAAVPVRAAVSGYVYLCDAEASRFSGRSDPQTWSLAAQTWTDLGHPYPACYARYRLAEALFGHRARAAGALEALAAAHEVATRLGAGPLLHEIELLARRAAVVLPTRADAVAEALDEPAAPDPLAALTPRERLVLDRLAEGDSNRQIARALFISEKTASVHVSHILAKLSVSSRVQAGMFGQRVATANSQEN
jgi:DNA-binding CsgD family transcriptional regulator